MIVPPRLARIVSALLGLCTHSKRIWRRGPGDIMGQECFACGKALAVPWVSTTPHARGPQPCAKLISNPRG